MVTNEREARHPRPKRRNEQRLEHLTRLLDENMLRLERRDGFTIDRRTADRHSDHLHLAQHADLFLKVETAQLRERLVVSDHLLVIRLLPRVVPRKKHQVHQLDALRHLQVIDIRLAEQMVLLAVG